MGGGTSPKEERRTGGVSLMWKCWFRHSAFFREREGGGGCYLSSEKRVFCQKAQGKWIPGPWEGKGKNGSVSLLRRAEDTGGEKLIT